MEKNDTGFYFEGLSIIVELMIQLGLNCRTIV